MKGEIDLTFEELNYILDKLPRIWEYLLPKEKELNISIKTKLMEYASSVTHKSVEKVKKDEINKKGRMEKCK